MTRRNGRQLERVQGDILDHPAVPDVQAWAHPVPVRGSQELRIVVEHAPPALPVPEPVPPKRSKAVAWGLTFVALVVMLYSIWAAAGTLKGPQTHPVRQHPVDLVGPHR